MNELQIQQYSKTIGVKRVYDGQKVSVRDWKQGIARKSLRL